MKSLQKLESQCEAEHQYDAMPVQKHAPAILNVLVAILVLFGAKRIPEFAKGLGKGINEFKKASREVTDSLENEPPATVVKTTPAPAPPATIQASQTPPETKVILSRAEV